MATVMTNKELANRLTPRRKTGHLTAPLRSGRKSETLRKNILRGLSLSEHTMPTTLATRFPTTENTMFPMLTAMYGSLMSMAVAR